jgi:hypothetical protein
MRLDGLRIAAPELNCKQCRKRTVIKEIKTGHPLCLDCHRTNQREKQQNETLLSG